MTCAMKHEAWTWYLPSHLVPAKILCSRCEPCTKLRTLQNKQKAGWKSHISALVHAFNSTVNDTCTTGFSPFYLMFGRETKLPVDILFGFLRLLMKTSALQSPLQEWGCNKYIDKPNMLLSPPSNYDLKTRAAIQKKGDRVPVRMIAYEGKHKIADTWEDNPYIILVPVKHNIPVYKVMREEGEGRCRVLHRNLLSPIGSKFAALPHQTPNPLKWRKAEERSVSVDETVSIQSDSDTSSEFSL